MQLSTKPRYALRILLQLAISSARNETIKGKDLASAQGITDAYVEQIMLPLKRAEIVRSVRGCNGGYILARPAECVSVLEIIELYEGRADLVTCRDEGGSCDMFEECAMRQVWEDISTHFRSEADAITLASILSSKEL